MGQPKLVLPWCQTTIIGHLISIWREVGASVIAVVCSAANGPLQAELDRLGFPAAQRIINPDATRGMFSSVQCAAAWSGWGEAITHVGVALGDQPQIPRETLRRLLEFAAANPSSICQPSLEGRARHPIVLPRAILGRLARSDGPTLKDFLQSEQASRLLLETLEEALNIDLDTPNDYNKALANFGVTPKGAK
jgi:CTP:molybdopterin cytidylyltransferase MocA